MTNANHPGAGGDRRSTVLPPCCQAWAAEQTRPWTQRPHSTPSALHDDPPPRAAAPAAASDGAATRDEGSSDGND